jgi:TolA-binding protein
MDKNVPELSISDRFVAWYDANKQQAQLGVLILVLVGIGLGYFFWHGSEKDVASGEALTSVTLSLEGPNGSLRSGAAPALLKVASDYPGSKAAARARLLAAGSLFDEGKYDMAKGEFDKFLRDNKDTAFAAEALLGVAACLDAAGKTSEAINAYKNLIDHYSSDASIPQAKFSLARLYAANKQPEDARRLYEEVERSAPGTGLSTEAGMRVEELKAKFPALASVVTPMSTNMLPVR